MSKMAGVGGSIFVMAMTAVYFSNKHPPHPPNYYNYQNQRRSLESDSLITESSNLTNLALQETSSVLIKKLKTIALKENAAEENFQLAISTTQSGSLEEVLNKELLESSLLRTEVPGTFGDSNLEWYSKVDDDSFRSLTTKAPNFNTVEEPTTVKNNIVNTTVKAHDLVSSNSVGLESNRETDTSLFSDDDLYNATDEPFFDEASITTLEPIKTENYMGPVKNRSVGVNLELSKNLSQIKDADSRKAVVKQMMKHAWDNYVRYAWGKNELKPLSKKGHQGSVFGAQPLGATILDGLDTLYIMGMNEEFNQAKEWVVNEFDVNQVMADVSVFEVNIRFVAGMLSCFALTGEIVFREKAKQIADKLLPAFNTPTGIPHALVNFKTGASRNYGWASSSSSILSEFGTLHMEFAYLSDVTGNTIYRNKVDKIRHVLQETEKPNGLYPNYLNPRTGKWGQHHISMGALGDSFYEYLLKVWIQSNKEDIEAREMFDEALQPMFKHMLFTSPGGLTYFAERKFDRVEHKMDHLACFSGGLLGLASKTLKNELSRKYMDVAKQLTNTCHESYDRSYTKLGPESFRFTDKNLTKRNIDQMRDKELKQFYLEGSEARALKSSEKYYILRPEVIEAYFYMWRLTKDEKYREWAWEAAQAIEKYCRTLSGYTGIKNVYSEEPVQDDVQQSFFLAETLKYLYLIFSDDSLLSLDEWVLNTEAHPFPIKGINPFYREAA